MQGVRGSDALTLSGRLDGSTVPEVRASLESLIAGGDGDVVVDMTCVELIDAVGLGMLAAAHRRLERAGRHLVLRGCAGHVRRVLAVTGLTRVLHIEPVLRRITA